MEWLNQTTHNSTKGNRFLSFLRKQLSLFLEFCPCSKETKKDHKISGNLLFAGNSTIIWELTEEYKLTTVPYFFLSFLMFLFLSRKSNRETDQLTEPNTSFKLTTVQRLSSSSLFFPLCFLSRSWAWIRNKVLPAQVFLMRKVLTVQLPYRFESEFYVKLKLSSVITSYGLKQPVENQLTSMIINWLRITPMLLSLRLRKRKTEEDENQDSDTQIRSIKQFLDWLISVMERNRN